MKVFITSILPLLCVLAAASPLEAVKRGDPPPPSNIDPFCDTTDQSPGKSNIDVAAEAISQSGTCVHNGGKTELRHDDGVRIYMLGPAGTFSCVAIAEKLYTLSAQCQKNIAGDVRAGGVTWANTAADGTYLNVSK